jgi:hypothetical protein
VVVSKRSRKKGGTYSGWLDLLSATQYYCSIFTKPRTMGPNILEPLKNTVLPKLWKISSGSGIWNMWNMVLNDYWLFRINLVSFRTFRGSQFYKQVPYLRYDNSLLNTNHTYRQNFMKNPLWKNVFKQYVGLKYTNHGL